MRDIADGLRSNFCRASLDAILVGDLIGCVDFSMSAKVAELVDALDLGSSGATRESSSLSFRTSCVNHAAAL